MTRYLKIFICLILCAVSCETNSKKQDLEEKETLFTKLNAKQTNIDFINEIKNEEDFNIFLYRNFYNGGGVAIGDINNDNLPDIYLTANRKKNKLYLNKGNFTFEDITQSAGVYGNKAWSTGVVMVDINADGLLDIYVCNAGNIEGDDQKNELFINNGDLTFSEKAQDYNLADSGFTTHAAFFDYDKDGDLDAYILNNSFIPVASLGYENKRDVRAEDWTIPNKLKGGGDKLLRNDNGVYKDISKEANIYGSLIGFGLGVTIGDVNNDLYPDIYVSNDFFEHDYLYINNKNGTFTEDIKNWSSHLSLFSMGADMADINNDGKSDIFVTDMLPKGDERLKNTTNFETFDIYQLKLRNDYYHQYMQNTLQLNTGNSFSEIANYSGVSNTDWSWGALLFDMDNDGYRDIFVSNGIYHDLTNQDFIDFFEDVTRQQTAISGTKDQKNEVINEMPSTPIPNYAFKNNKDLTFKDSSLNWGFDEPSFSNGAAYGDLDNDGDLDLIINNVNQEVSVYKNNSEQNNKNYIKLKLQGEQSNTFGIGSIVDIYIKNDIIHQELNPSRGFQSSIDYTMTIGIGEESIIDSLRIIWPNNLTETYRNVKVNETTTLKQKEALHTINTKTSLTAPLLKEIKLNLESHRENKHIDFDYEGLITEMLSQEGPAMAVGDVNGDGNEDVFIGGAKNQAAKIYLNKGSGSLKAMKTLDIFREDKNQEDTAASFFDADQDGDLDLIVGSGGNEINQKNNYLNRLYINDGKGNFIRSLEKLKSTKHNVSDIAPEDFDNDGDIDLIITSRSVPGTYGVNPEHLFLENNGKGNFNDITESKAYELKDAGMITAAIWQDIDGDSKKDLITVGDWEAPKIYKNNGRRLVKLNTNLDSLLGWWNIVDGSDLDGDGDIDLVLGNRGSNSSYNATKESPSRMYINDYDDNGTLEQIITRSINGEDFPISLKREITNQLVSLKKQNLKFSEYATKRITDLFEPKILENSILKTVNTSQSVIAINDGEGNFTIRILPKEAQFSCICAITCSDINKDGRLDILLGGNNYEFKPQFSRLDALNGGVLIQNSENEFEWSPYKETGFFVKGEMKHILPFKDKTGNTYYIIGRNNNSPQIFTSN